jgi:penicillin-insensitive murein DD-endopeptidase
MGKKYIACIAILFAHYSFAEKPASQCYGTTADGHLDNGWQLPSSGKNFEAYSSLGVLAGRNYVHSQVYQTLLAAYKTLETTAPDRFFIYGETGYEQGGRFKPHKTHTNGLSVDFFVPVLNEKQEPAKLPISPFNKLGYNIEFDKQAKYNNLTIDFEAIAKHLHALKQAADAQKVGINLVIFDNDFQTKLFQTPSGKSLPELIRFSVKKPWVRHDEHYHVDFDVKCKR